MVLEGSKDEFNRVEMLGYIEGKIDLYCDLRERISRFGSEQQKKEMHQKEKNIETARREEKLFRKKQAEEVEKLLKAERNMEKVKKQDRIVVLPGKKPMFRSPKPLIKQRFTETTEYSEEYLDYVRYVLN